MKTGILSSLILLILLNSMLTFKLKVKQITPTCNYSFLDNKKITCPSEQVNKILGFASYFGVLTGQILSTPGKTTVVGSVGVSDKFSTIPSFITIIGGTGYTIGKETTDANLAAKNAFISIAAMPTDTDLTGQNLVGLVLLPGVYNYNHDAFLTGGTLTLDANGDEEAEWFFKIGNSLVLEPGTKIVVINGGSPYNVYWQVVNFAQAKTNSIMVGNILAKSSIFFDSGVILSGRALCQSGYMSLISSYIYSVPCKSISPESNCHV